MVDVHYRERYRQPISSQRLELEGGHGAGGVLDQDLVYGKIYLLPGDELTHRKVIGEQFPGKVLRLGHARYLLCTWMNHHRGC